MPDDEEPRIIADDDWKAEAQREKEKLTEEAEQEQATKETGEAKGSLFLDLLDMLAQQILLAMGGAQLPDGRTIPGNPQAAKHLIDILGELEVKTKGNLSQEEAELLKSLLSRLRWAFATAASQAGGAAAPAAPNGASPPPPSQGGKSSGQS